MNAKAVWILSIFSCLAPSQPAIAAESPFLSDPFSYVIENDSRAKNCKSYETELKARLGAIAADLSVIGNQGSANGYEPGELPQEYCYLTFSSASGARRFVAHSSVPISGRGRRSGCEEIRKTAAGDPRTVWTFTRDDLGWIFSPQCVVDWVTLD